MTEFLPVSSSGHLVIAQNILNIQGASLAFDVMLHIGTLIPVIIIFWKDIVNLIIEFFLLIRDLFRKAAGKNKKIDMNANRVFVIMIIAATIPTAIIGYFFNDWAEHLFGTLDFVGFSLLITGILMSISDKLAKGKKGIKDIRLSNAITIGIFQGLAITPGISRSGSTIFAGLLNGFTRETATRFSFIASIPVILGAAIIEGKSVLQTGIHPSVFLPVSIGMIFAAISGFFAIKMLIRLLNRGKLHYFSYYCWTLGLFVIIYNFFIK